MFVENLKPVDTAAEAGRKAGENLAKMVEASKKLSEISKNMPLEHIAKLRKVILASDKEVVLFMFGHNYGPSLQPGFRSLTELECLELCRSNSDLIGRYVFIVTDKDSYFCYDSFHDALVPLNPFDSLSKVMESKNPILQSDLPFWHHYISYLPQIKLTM